MAKSIKEMNEQELAAEKEKAKFKFVDGNKGNETLTETGTLSTVEPFEVTPLSPTLGTKVAATEDSPARMDLGRLKTNISKPENVSANPRLVRRQENANAYLDALAAKEKELGRALTKQEIADWDDPKGLFAYQSLNNKKGNWANAFGANAFFGSLNDDTYNMLRRDLDARGEQEQRNQVQDNKSDRVVAIVPMVGGHTRAVTRGQQIAHQNLGSTITDINDLSPEQANAIVGILRKDHTIPENIKFESSTTLANVLDQLDDYVSDEELQALGYYNDDMVATIPHKETFEDIMARREKAEEAMRLQSQQRALERQRARAGLADLAAGIGDMIKASGGAIVTPRDYRAMYDSLTAQQQTNYNNYLARMQALKEQEKEKRRLAEERAYNEKLLKEQERQKYEMLLAQHKLDLELQEQKANDALELQGLKGAQAMERLQKNIEASYTKQEKAALDKGNSIYFNNAMHELEPNKTNQVYAGVYGVLLPYLMNNPFFSSALSGIEDPYAEKSASKVVTAVQAAVKNKEVMSKLSDSEKQEIMDLINLGVKGNPISVAPVTPAAPVTPSTPATPSAPAGNDGGMFD